VVRILLLNTSDPSAVAVVAKRSSRMVFDRDRHTGGPR
jgi:hypothetical protein